jgi:hypothetical protein
MRDRKNRPGEYEYDYDEIDRYRRDEGRYDVDDQNWSGRGRSRFGSGGPGRFGEAEHPGRWSQGTMPGRQRKSNLGLERLPSPRSERYGPERGSAGMSRCGPFDRWEGEREQTWGGRRSYISHPDDYDAGNVRYGRDRSRFADSYPGREDEYGSVEPEREQTWGGLRAYQGSPGNREDYERYPRRGYGRQEGGSRYEADLSGRSAYRDDFRDQPDRNRGIRREGMMDEELGRYEHYHRPSSNRSDLSRWEYDREDLGYGSRGYDTRDRDDDYDFDDDFRWRRNR